MNLSDDDVKKIFERAFGYLLEIPDYKTDENRLLAELWLNSINVILNKIEV